MSTQPISPEIPQQEAVPQGPETGMESPDSGAGFEVPAPRQEQAQEAAPAPAPAAPARSMQAPGTEALVKEVEDVLEAGLKDTYNQMPPDLKVQFKKEAERVSREIVGMVRTLKVKAGRVLKLIVGWLKMIPGVNRFFLVQEAKIKTDRVLELVEEEKKKQGVF
jgi:hypothetical protein